MGKKEVSANSRVLGLSNRKGRITIKGQREGIGLGQCQVLSFRHFRLEVPMSGDIKAVFVGVQRWSMKRCKFESYPYVHGI